VSLYRRPGSPYYWSKLYVDGDVVRFSTRKRTRVEALRVERDEVDKLEAKRKREGHYTLKILGVKFLEWKEEQARSKGRAFSSETDKMREKHLRVIGRFFSPECDPRTIDVEAQERFRAERMKQVGAGTVCKELSTLRQVLKFAANVAKIMPAAPLAKNPEHHYTAAAWRILTREELLRFLAALGGTRGREVLPWALLRANTGMRPTEATMVRWEMINYATGAIDLPGPITKNRAPRSVPLNEGAWEALWMMAVQRGPGPAIGRVFAESNHYTAWHNARETAKVGKLRPHDLRHTLASYLHGDGVPLAVIRDILGHKTLDMVNRYAHTFSDARAAAVAAVSVSVPRNVPSGGAAVPGTGSKGTEAGVDARRASATVK